jgi:hypothetical protein
VTPSRAIPLSSCLETAASYAAFLSGLTPTTDLGNITLKKNQSMTVKLGPGVNVVAIGTITTAGGNTLTLSAPKNAVVVVNVSGGLNLHNVIWNIESANPTFSQGVTFNGTLLNEAEGTVVTFNTQSVINGAVLTNGDLLAPGSLRLNFWPFTAKVVQ